MNALSVAGLGKRYDGFALEDVGFALQPGRIMGFIGRNGAGKTTTLKAIMGMVRPDCGRVLFWGLPLEGNEAQIKRRVGFVSGGFEPYAKARLGLITRVTRRFYPAWDEEAYRGYLKRFDLNEDKTPRQLSAGMRVKYALVLALCRGAELLILDEPTSGLDPVSREDLLEIFMDLAQAGKAILFSTHITADLDKCADDITYIRQGKIAASEELKGFAARFRVAEGPQPPAVALGVRRMKTGCSALIPAEDEARAGMPCRRAGLDDIMVHLERDDGA